jgi:heterodisulfide reductase subunit C
MTYGPDRVLRMAALGQEEELLHSKDIWLCLGCFTCATRCPNDIDIAAVMDALRQMAVKQGVPAAERDALLFHQIFMGVVERMGRSHEAVMLGLFKVLAHVPLMNDVPAGIGLFMRGKVPLLPDRTKSGREVARMIKARRQA